MRQWHIADRVKGIDYVNLINAEKVDLDFKIEGNFLHGEESVSHHIVIDPMSGIVSAESECELRLEITPKYAGEEMFLVKCAVKKCKDPLQLYVHIHTYAVLPVLIHEISSKQNVELVHSKTNHITLENMTPRIPQSLTFIILNMGKPSIIYKWEENEEHIKHSKVELCFSKKTGIITCQSKEYISLNFTALSKITFKDILVTLKISKGPQYNILFSGTAEIPIYEFSFYEYNFGPCFVCTLEDSVYKALLCVTNKDEDLIVVETSYKDSEYLHVVIPQNGVVKPRSVLEVLIGNISDAELSDDEVHELSYFDKQIEDLKMGISIQITVVMITNVLYLKMALSVHH
ncbi:hydrocephalus-inducing protein homolog [Lycorma delicatula]|uniref:hydrocephalus-inducing protein homolog n=1 Tax=Lycorma delicatula TaxID=130591 RepID=UPI003F50E046